MFPGCDKPVAFIHSSWFAEETQCNALSRLWIQNLGKLPSFWKTEILCGGGLKYMLGLSFVHFLRYDVTYSLMGRKSIARVCLLMKKVCTFKPTVGLLPQSFTFFRVLDMHSTS